MRKLLALMFVGALLLAGCGDGGDDQAGGDPTPAATDAASTDDVQAGGECTDNSKLEGQADLEMQDYRFAPPCLQINVNQGLRIHNEGGAAHNFSVENIAGLDVDVQPGEENNTERTGLTEGTYTFYCNLHRESNDMEGELRVVPA